MPYNDLREFIARLEAEGEVQRIEESVDWNLEAGAMLRRAYEKDLPAPFFQKIKDYPAGYRLFSGGVSNYRRVALALDMAPDTHPRDLIEEYLKRKQRPIKPVLVNDGPCKENIHIGDKVDLFEFPVPMIHEGDGGRYIGTWHFTVSRDLDSDWVNWGMYRHMVHDKNTVGITLGGPAQHLALMSSRAYAPRNKPMDVAIVIGVEPVSTLCAVSPLPYGVSEVDIAGGIRGEPIELVKCETVDLAVPATSEIVIEGEIRPGELMDEGPFGEYTGYTGKSKEPKPVIHVKAITHRNDPILTFCSQGTPVSDGCVSSIANGAEVLEALRVRGLPVSSVAVPPESGNILFVAAVKNRYSGVVSDVAYAIWATKRGSTLPYVVIVEDDVDPFNIAQVLHALVTKCHPDRGIVKLPNSHTASLMPFLNRHERQNSLGAKAYFDCTWPLDWDPSDVPTRSSFDDVYSPAVRQEALAKWRKYGY